MSLSAAPAEPAPEVPFELVGNQIVVSAKLNGKGPYLMTLDTSADSSTIDISAALKMGLTVNPAGEEVEGGETEEGTVYDTRFTVVELGGISARDVDALAGGMVAKLAKRLARPVVGVLGHNFLTGRIIQIDYPKRILRFLPDSPAAGPASGRRTVLTFKDDDGVVFDGISINGQPLKGAIDTGLSGSVTLTPEGARKLGLSPGKTPVEVHDVSVGPVSVHAATASFWQAGAGHEKKPWEAAVGNAILKDYVLTIDYSTLKLVIEKP